MLDEQLQNLLQDIARTVAGDLRTIFARVRVRGAKQADKNLVDDFLSIVYLPESQCIRFAIRQRLPDFAGVKMRLVIRMASAPETRMLPIAPPWAVAMAQMVS